MRNVWEESVEWQMMDVGWNGSMVYWFWVWLDRLLFLYVTPTLSEAITRFMASPLTSAFFMESTFKVRSLLDDATVVFLQGYPKSVFSMSWFEDCLLMNNRNSLYWLLNLMLKW